MDRYTEFAAMEAQLLASKHSEITRNFIRSCPDFCRNATMDAVKAADPLWDEEILEVTQEYIDNVIKGGFQQYVICGDVGVGKSFLAVATVRAIIDALHKKGLFVNLPKFFDPALHKEGESIPMHNILNTFILILDDLIPEGCLELPEWHKNKIYTIIDFRSSASLPTIVTSNQKLDEFQILLGDAIYDRLRIAGTAVDIVGTSRRK